jgi:inner membrane transporter RhtA
MAVGAMFSVQLGSALSLPLIGEVGAAGTAWLRLTAGALIFIAIARPPLRQIAAGDLPALAALGVTTGLMTIMFLAAIEHIPLRDLGGHRVPRPAFGRRGTQPHETRPAVAGACVDRGAATDATLAGEIELVGIGFAIGSAVCWALYILLTQHVGERFTGTRALSITMPISAATAR